MNKQKWLLLSVTLLLIGSSAGLLLRLTLHQRLGTPALKHTSIPGRPNVELQLPEHVLDYQSEALPPDDIAVAALPKDTSFGQRRYRAPDGFQFNLDVVLMGADRTSIHKPQFCLRGAGLEIRSMERVMVPIQRPYRYDLPVMKLTVSPEKQAQGQPVSGVYVYWFVADKEFTAEHWQRMWWLMRDVVSTGVLQRWAYLYCFAPCAPGQEEAAFARLKSFIADAVPQFYLSAPPPASATLARP